MGRLGRKSELCHKLGQGAGCSDTELVRLAYERFGSSFPKVLHGEFAFAIWDRSKRKLLAGRDVAGCQPVYYHVDSQRLVISDQIELLLNSPGVSHDFDEPYLAAILSRIYSHPERTHYKDVRKIPSAHTLSICQGKVTVEPYWRPENVVENKWKDPLECRAAFREVVGTAVNDRMPDDDRGVGIHLSGGLDCSTIGVFAAGEQRRGKKPAPLAFSWQPAPTDKAIQDDATRAEYERIESVCEQESLDPIYCAQSKDDVLEVLHRDDTVRHICGGTYGEWVVQREASKRDVGVILAGFGGDDGASFNGRGYFNGLALRGQWGRLAGIANASGGNPWRLIGGSLRRGMEHRLLPTSLHGKYDQGVNVLGLGRWKSFARALPLSAGLSKRNLTERAAGFEAEMQPYLSPELQGIKALPPWPMIRETSARSVQSQLLQMGHLVNRIESWAADGALRNIRYAYPLLDRSVLDFVLSLPEDVFLNGEWNRLFFRESMDPILPKNVCWERDNAEPARADGLRKAVEEAFAEVGHQLRVHGSKSPRAVYLDMPRLIRDLDPEALRRRTKFGRLFFAVQFLGI